MVGRINPFDQIYKSMILTDTKRCFEDPIEFPKELHVELTNRCNLRCPFCPTGCRNLKRPIGDMREFLWWAICTEVHEYKTAIRLVRWGEPTLNVRCFDFIKQATSIGIPVHLNTNGIKLDVKAILDSGLDSLKVSLHNPLAVKSICKLIKERGKKTKPFITVSLLTTENEKWGKGRIYGGMPHIEADKFTYVETLNLHQGDRIPKSCWELYNRLSIDWDGQVVACCGAYDRQMRLGHIYDKDTLKGIWDGDALRRYREMEQSGRLGDIPLCSHCARHDIIGETNENL